MALFSVVAGSGACSVDQGGLETVAKLSRDAAVPATGGGPGTGEGGSPVTGTGGAAVGSGGSSTGGSPAATGGSPGTGGAQPGTGGGGAGTSGGATGGAAGAPADTGGTTGAGGMAGGGATGGGAGQSAGGTGGGLGGSTGGSTGGSGGAVATGGAGGVMGTGGQAGQVGMGGRGGSGGSGQRCGATCMGCCANGVCVTSLSAQQCGAHGAACATCGSCQTCSAAGACDIDPQSQWTIVAAGAQVAMSPPGGGTWDPAHGDEGGVAPDLFCEYENPSGDVTPTTAGVTSTIIDTYAATWNQTITPTGVTVSAAALMAAKPAWRIWVGDEDCSRGNVCNSGQIVCAYQQAFTAAQLMSGSASITSVQSCQSLDLKLVCASGP